MFKLKYFYFLLLRQEDFSVRSLTKTDRTNIVNINFFTFFTVFVLPCNNSLCPFYVPSIDMPRM